MISKRRLLLWILGFVIVCFGDSLNYTGAVGVAPYEAVILTLNYLTFIKVGTISIAFNLTLVAGQIIGSRKIKLQYILQIPSGLLQGVLINFFVYNLFANLPQYMLARECYMLFGIMISATGVGLMMVADVIPNPLEGFCQVISEILKKDFAKMRQAMDIVFVIFCVGTSLLLHVDFAVREGTVLCALIFAPIMGMVMKKFEKI